MNFRFWISLIGVLLIASSATLIWFLLRKKESQSHLLPTLGFDALDPPLKAIYIRSTTWEVQFAQFGEICEQFTREFRRAIFELQCNSQPDEICQNDLLKLKSFLEVEPRSNEAFSILLKELHDYRKKAKKKEPTGLDSSTQ